MQREFVSFTDAVANNKRLKSSYRITTMLNRKNEINIIDSYTGIYDFKENDSSTIRINDSIEYLICDKNLRLMIDLKDKEKKTEFKFSDSDNISALFFGELFNFKELIEKINWGISDKETLSFSKLCCLLYKKFGVHFAKHINGMFSVVLRDKKEKLLLLIVDRFGSARPIYYNISAKLFFSSHLKKLLLNCEVDENIDKNALALFLKYSYIPSPNTIIENVRKLNPGEMLIFKGENFRLERYLDFEVKREKISVAEAVYQYNKLLSNSISLRLEKQKNQNIGVFLSGGLDSSANVALAAELGIGSFETYGVGFDNPKIDERPYAKIVADHFDVPFNDYVFNGTEIEDLPQMLWQLEQPFLENGLLLTYAGFKSINQKADIIISGNCTDQLFGTGGFADGKPIALRLSLETLNIMSIANQVRKLTKGSIFNKDNDLFKFNVLMRRCTNFNDWFFWGFDYNELCKLCNFDISLEKLDIFPNNLIDLPKNLDAYYQHSIIHQDIEHYACQNVLVKSYRIADMFDIYGRDPYLDYNVVDFLLSLDLKLKRSGGLFDYFKNSTKSKYIHRLAMKNILPDSILNKPKQGGFVNMSLCLDDPQKRNMIFNHILHSDILKEYLNIKYIKKMLQQYEMLISKKINWVAHRDSMAGKILYLLTISIWYNVFIDNRKAQKSDCVLSDLI